jgi:hypothetical protein
MSEITKTIHQVGKMVGIPEMETDAILVKIRANQELLDKCVKPHDFSVCLDRHTKQPITNPSPEQCFGAKWRCSKCGGYTDSVNRSWYNRGLEDSNNS